MLFRVATNALVHGTRRISLRIDVASDALRIEVSDQGNITLAPSPTPGAHGGRGLQTWISSPMTGATARAAPRSGPGSARRHTSADQRRAAKAAGVRRSRAALPPPPERGGDARRLGRPREESKPSNLGTSPTAGSLLLFVEAGL